MYDNETFIQATGSASNKYTLDLSSCTKVDTGSMEGGSTSLGASSTMGLAAGVHGIWDGGMDGYALLKAIETVPERGQLLRVTMTCSGATGDPGGSNTVLSLMLSPDVSPAANEGYKGSGFIRSGTPNNKVSKVGKISAGISNDAVLVGTLKASFDVPWGASAPLGICSHVFGSTSGEHWSHKSDGNSGSWGAPCVGVAMENVNSSGGAEVVWSDVVITIEVID